MFYIKKLMRILLGQKTLSHSPLFQQSLMVIVVLILLTVIAGVMAGGVLVAGLYLLYQLLQVNDVGLTMTIIVTVGALLFIIGILAALMAYYLRQLRMIFLQVMKEKATLSSPLSTMAMAFMDGVFASSQKK